MTGRVLLIEDEPNIAEAIRFILGRNGLQVFVQVDGRDGLAAVESVRPDLVILDLMLPGMDGMEVLGHLRRDPATQSLPVLMLTAKGQGRARAAATRAGVSAFMTKPFSNADMVAAVRALLGAA